jgi:Na+/H+ antiporter NhaC
MASGCDHVDHVRTQLPYALFSALLSGVVGYLAFAAVGAHPGILLVIGVSVVGVWVRVVGRPRDAT